MATFDTKFCRLHVERSDKENALNLGVESNFGSGFASVPFGKRELIHTASLLGAAALLRGAARQQRGAVRAQKDVQRRQKQSGAFGGKRGFGGGKRGRGR